MVHIGPIRVHTFEWHLEVDWFIRFSTMVVTNRHIDKHTMLHLYSVAIGHICALRVISRAHAMRPNNSKNVCDSPHRIGLIAAAYRICHIAPVFISWSSSHGLLHTLWVKKTTRHQTLGHNSTNYYPIFKNFSLADSAVNLQQIHV